jgi:pyruvate formate lyase activating enzyme
LTAGQAWDRFIPRSRQTPAMSIAGIIFDIVEFAVHDGPGIRTSVFLKGCPLDCQWCHNPEGKSSQPQAMQGAAGPRIAGKWYTAEALARRLNRQADILKAGQGGVTFSGGEPLAQADFVLEVIEQLDGLHVLLDTSGFADEADFRRVAQRCDLVYFDLKLIDEQMHQRYIGRSNRPILNNLRLLSTMGLPFVVRVPLAPGVTDTPENLSAIALQVRGLPGLLRVDLLPYNRAAGAKYQAAGLLYAPDFDENQACRCDTGVFEEMGIAVRVA